MNSKEFIRKLYLEFYENRPEKKVLEKCIRCGSRGVLGKRKPYTGLCRKCRKKEFNQ